jgi:hypothetical protein
MRSLRPSGTGGETRKSRHEFARVSAWLIRWIDNYAVHTCQAKTFERYRQLVKYITASAIADIAAVAQAPIATLKHVQLEGSLRALLNQEGKRRAHISAHTVRHVAGVFRSPSTRPSAWT